ncbi:MAG: sigma-54 dependent transcriptional regulator [Candidatus Omnitrophota bacterium]|nr:sigma-54 dependent transcriptional regulator [Candidatus Omnitrophota bacterium]
MSLSATLLIVEDEKNTREGLQRFLEGLDYEVLTAEDGVAGWEIYKKEKPDLVIADIRMPGLDGVGLLEKIRADNPDMGVLLLTAYGSVEDAVKAMKKGAFYYLTKPINLEEVEFLIKKALTSRSLEEENRELKQALFSQKFEKGEILAESSVMTEVLKTVDQVALSQAAVLIEGESGTGKELIAHRIHARSPRALQPFVAVHCASLTETLLASELFGHEKGAFTGATERRIGRFERADRGTLFLDEVGEISPEMQVKLLRVLQEGELERVGGTKTIKVNVRLVCATNKSLAQETRAGRFREDLYYRINVIYVHIPPLRDRREDIAALAHYFVKHFASANGKKIEGVSSEAMQALRDYSWPGNVRELRNIMERIVVLARENRIEWSHVPADIRSLGVSAAVGAGAAIGGNASIQDMERELIRTKLDDARGNKSQAAKKLGISRRTLYRKIDEYDLK